MAVQHFPISASRGNPMVALSITFLERLFAELSDVNFSVRFWNGAVWQHGSSSEFALVLNHPGALQAMLSAGEQELGEAYIFDDVDIEGDIEASFGVADYLAARAEHSQREKLRLSSLLTRLPGMDRTRGAARPAQLEGQVHSTPRDRR